MRGPTLRARIEATLDQARQATLLMRAAAACLLFVVCWGLTSDTRLDPLNGDPFAYLYASYTVREGRGLRYRLVTADVVLDNNGLAATIPNDGQGPDLLFAVWPPVYPAALALTGGGLAAARILNAVGLWATLGLGWVFLRRYDVPASATIGVLLAFLVIMSDQQRTYTQAMSEVVFVPAFLAWLILLPGCEDDRSLIAASLLATAVGLTRYIGMPLIVLGALWVWYRRGLVGMLAYGAAPGVLYTWWLTRNYYVIGHLTGHAAPRRDTFEAILRALGDLVWLWMLLVVAFAGGLFCLAWFWARWSSRTSSSSLEE